MNLTIQEIYNQYNSLNKTLDHLSEMADKIIRFFKTIKPQRIIFTGCGSSYCLCKSFARIAAQKADIPAYAIASGDLWLNHLRYKKLLSNALLIAVSRSGRTSEIIHSVDVLRHDDIHFHFLSIICSTGTEMQKVSDFCIELPWAFDYSVCQTQSVTNLFTACTLLTHYIIDYEKNINTLKNQLASMASYGEAFLKKIEPVIKQIAQLQWVKVIVLADAEISGLAEVGVMSFIEMSRVSGHFYNVLDVRHGPLTLISEDTLVIIPLKNPLCIYENALVKDLVNLKAKVITYSNSTLVDLDPLIRNSCTHVTFGHNIGDIPVGLGLLAICQLLAYYKSTENGFDPDNPVGLSPWVQI